MVIEMSTSTCSIAILKRLEEVLSLSSYLAIFGHSNIFSLGSKGPLSLLGCSLLLLSVVCRYASLWLPSSGALRRAVTALPEMFEEVDWTIPRVGLGDFAKWSSIITNTSSHAQVALTANDSTQFALIGLALVPRCAGLFVATGFYQLKMRRFKTNTMRAASSPLVPWLLTISVTLVSIVASLNPNLSLSSPDLLTFLQNLSEPLHAIAVAHETSILLTENAVPAKLFFLTFQTALYGVKFTALVLSGGWSEAGLASLPMNFALVYGDHSLTFIFLNSVLSVTRSLLHFKLKQNWSFLMSLFTMAAVLILPTKEEAISEYLSIALLNRIYFILWIMLTFGGGFSGSLLLLTSLRFAVYLINIHEGRG